MEFPGVLRSLERRLLASLWVWVFFSAVTALYFYPTFEHFNTAIIGPPEDNTIFAWFLWYGSRAIFDPQHHFFHTTLMYHPEGMGLWYANYFYFGVAVAALLKPLMGLAATYNALVLLSFVASGAAAFALIKYLTGGRLSACLGAFVYAFSPMHFGHALHHPSVASIQFLPLFLLFVIRAHREGGWFNRCCASVMLGLAAYCDWNFLIYGWICLAMVFPWTSWREKRLFSAKAMWNLAVIGAGSFAITAPVLIPMLAVGLKHPDTVYLPGHNLFVADLLGFVIPHKFHSLAGIGWIKSINGPMTGPPWESAVYLGWINIALAGAAVIRLRKAALPYLAAFFIWAVLAMGVELHIRGALTGIPLPYALFESVPFLKHARNPSRVMAYGYLFWSILVAMGVKTLFRSQAPKRRRLPVLAVIAGLVFMDYYALASDMTPVQLPPVYTPVTKDPEYPERGFAIMNIPWDKGRYMMEQTVHGLPDLQGYLGRKFSVPLIGRLPFDDLSRQKEMLTENRVKYILIRKKRMSWDPSILEEVRVYNGISQLSRVYARVYSKVYEDDRDALFRVY
jgi:hypothetical protein